MLELLDLFLEMFVLGKGWVVGLGGGGFSPLSSLLSFGFRMVN